MSWETHLLCILFSLAIGKEGELTIGTIDDIQKLHIRTVPLGEHPCRISHQEHSRTFAICSAKYSPSGSNGEDMETHYVRLIDDQTFEIISSFALDPYENGCSIITCSFTDDFNAYYCVGTAYALPEESEPSKVCFISYFLFCLNIVVNIAFHLYANLLDMFIIVLQIFLNHVLLIVFTVMCLVQ